MKIISKDEKDNGLHRTGFFCKIPYLKKKIKVLFTNYHILNYNSKKKGNTIKISYKNEIKMIKITDERNYWTNELNDFICIEILNNNGIEDFYEIGYFDKDIKLSYKYQLTNI